MYISIKAWLTWSRSACASSSSFAIVAWPCSRPDSDLSTRDCSGKLEEAFDKSDDSDSLRFICSTLSTFGGGVASKSKARLMASSKSSLLRAEMAPFRACATCEESEINESHDNKWSDRRLSKGTKDFPSSSLVLHYHCSPNTKHSSYAPRSVGPLAVRL